MADPVPVPVDRRRPLPPPNPLLGQTVDDVPARSLVDRTPLDLDAIKATWLRVCGGCDAGMLTDCTHPDGDYRPVMAALVDELEQARADLAAERQEAFMSKVWFERYQASAEAFRIEREMRAQVEVDARRLDAQVERVEAAMRTTGIEGFVKYEDLEAALGHKVRSDIDDIVARAALAVPAAEETTTDE